MSQTADDFFKFIEGTLEIEIFDWQRQLITQYMQMSETDRKLAVVRPRIRGRW